MKKLSLILIGLLFIPTLFLTSCDKGDDTLVVSTPAQTLMVDYMLANNLDLDKVLTSPDSYSFVQGAPATDADVPAFLAKYYIIDIRSADAFNTSRISGAKNVLFANILAEGPLAGAKPILVVCYTGQTACYATALLRMYGYKNTQALKWGMSGWNGLTNSWTGKIASPANGHANWTTNPAPTNSDFSKPSFTSLSTTGEAILKKRVEQVVAGTATNAFTIAGATVLDNPSNYFINNYFSAASNDFLDFGHINGAYRINPLLISDNSILAISPTSKVVTYCYTGQTSAIVTAWLRVLGYDAYSLSFGMNGLYSNHPTAWTSNHWGFDSNPKNLTLTTN